jgi:hypothetical protein
MRLIATLCTWVFIALTLAACSGSDDDAAESPTAVTASPTAATAPSTPTPLASMPAGTETGVAEVDEVLAVLLRDDDDAFQDLVQPREVACTTVVGLGGPPKCAGAPGSPPDGIIVSAFPVLHCEGGWLFDAESVRLGSDDLELHSVYALSLPGPLFDEPYMPQPEYAIVLAGPEGAPPEQVYLEDGAIVVTQVSCDPLLPPAMA